MLNPGFCGDIELAPQTNEYRFRTKSVEELAAFLSKNSCPPDDERVDCGGDCPDCWERWLRQPVKDGEGNG